MKKLIIVSLAVVLVFGLIGINVTAMHGNMGRRNFDDRDQTVNNYSGFGFGGMMGPGGMLHTTVESEYDFLIKMIPHHQEAVRTAKTLKNNSENVEIREFADQIITSQTAEIEQMNNHLNNWYPARDNDYNYEPMMDDYSELESPQLEQAFLEDMIFHHMEAVMMSQQLLVNGLAEHEEVAELADNIRNNQREEIFMMRNWLTEDSFSSNIPFGSGMRGGMGMMARGFFNRTERNFSNYNFSDLSEAEIDEFRIQMRAATRLDILREEYRQLIKDGASDEELRSIENEIFELQEKVSNNRTGFFLGRESAGCCW